MFKKKPIGICFFYTQIFSEKSRFFTIFFLKKCVCFLKFLLKIQSETMNKRYSVHQLRDKSLNDRSKKWFLANFGFFSNIWLKNHQGWSDNTGTWYYQVVSGNLIRFFGVCIRKISSKRVNLGECIFIAKFSFVLVKSFVFIQFRVVIPQRQSF